MNSEPAEKNRGKKVISSKELFAENREIVIEHNENLYRLSITKSGKLILNK